jgi:HD-GYP domain-containing protein (c-di-GMP phosphodiesterase class II)
LKFIRAPFLFHRKLIQRADEIEQLKKHGIREVVIDVSRGADVAQVQAAAVSQNTEAKIASASATAAVRDEAPQRRVTPVSQTSVESIVEPIARELETARTVHDEALALAQSIFEGTDGGKPIDGEVAGKIVTNLQESIVRSPEANLLLMQMQRFQRDLFNHAVNVCVLSLVVAESEGIEGDRGVLGMGALLHDIGETRLPRALLARKLNELSDSEATLFKQHPSFGAGLLAQSKDVPFGVERIIFDHHERIDGSGYPAGEKNLSVHSQLVALTDRYDDMLSGRHQPALQPTEVLRQLYLQANAGSADRGLVEKVIRSLGVYPIGSVVELNTGERAVVISSNRSAALKPTVKIIMTRSGLVQFNGMIVSLAESARDAIERRIVAVLDPLKERIDPLVFFRVAPSVV